MVIVKLMGGLGNQMFQYAAGRRLAIHHKTKLKLDISSFQKDKLRSYQLHNLRIEEAIAHTEEISRLTKRPQSRSNRIVHRMLLKLGLLRSTVFRETDFTVFDSSIFKTPRDVYLNGYWGSEKYFIDIASIIRSEFSPRLPVSQQGTQIAKYMAEENSVSLHVRRGDYVTNPSANSIFGVLPLDYYRSALSRISSQIDNIHLFVFSDDPQWVVDNIQFSFPTTYVTHNEPERAFEDMWLMSQCKNHIVANSTFSWWGAWLSPFQRKIVVAPKKWYQSDIRVQDLIPSGWITQ